MCFCIVKGCCPFSSLFPPFCPHNTNITKRTAIPKCAQGQMHRQRPELKAYFIKRKGGGGTSFLFQLQLNRNQETRNEKHEVRFLTDHCLPRSHCIRPSYSSPPKFQESTYSWEVSIAIDSPKRFEWCKTHEGIGQSIMYNNEWIKDLHFFLVTGV